MTTPDKPSEKNQALAKDGNLAQKLQVQLAEKMMGTFDFVLSGRSKYYSENPDKAPSPSAIPAIINSDATMNMAVSGGISLIPGPWGMAAAVPEVAILVLFDREAGRVWFNPKTSESVIKMRPSASSQPESDTGRYRRPPFG